MKTSHLFVKVRIRCFALFLSAVFVCLFPCSCRKAKDVPNHVYMCLGMNVSTLDPASAADLASQNVCAAIYDTLLQYKYGGTDNIPEPSMLREMPRVSEDGLTLDFVLRDDLFFQPAAPFDGHPKEYRKVTSRDVVFSLLRLADARLNSPSYWLLRDNVLKIRDFYDSTKRYADGDYSPYDMPVPGIKIIDDTHFSIHLAQRNPNFIYLLAMPPASIVSRKALEYYGLKGFRQHPCGSGPYRLCVWQHDYKLELERYNDYRPEFFTGAESPADRVKLLPLADRITCYLVKQNVSSWLLFLQGNLDYYQLDAEHFQSLIDENGELTSSLKQRCIKLLYTPRMETNYIGFNFRDPVLGRNVNLRRAISLAIDKKRIVSHAGGILSTAYGPIPPGLPGAVTVPDLSPYGTYDPIAARKLLKESGYENGIDPQTGSPLKITIDFPGTDTFNQQLGEIVSRDLKAIGIECVPCLNTRPRFQSKILSGEIQLFRYSWVADYPDAENFLQVFYSKNSANGIGSNRACYSNAQYDALYEKMQFLPASAERDALCAQMVGILLNDSPWVFETHTLNFYVTHSWLQNFKLHDFAMNRWKYLSAPADERNRCKEGFTPISISELH